MPLSHTIKKELFSAINAQPDAFGSGYDEESLFEFISEIWDLENMPSSDSRYDNASQDIVQHTIRNHDWETDSLFLDHLNLAGDDDDIFIRFIEQILAPKYRKNGDEIRRFVLLIDPYLEKDGYKLAIEGYDGAKPVYKVYPREEVELLPAQTKKNTIPFFRQTRTGARADYTGHHAAPTTFPCFVLVFNDGWNDYSYQTSHYLYYYNSLTDVSNIGEVKIMFPDREMVTRIPDEFVALEGFCSLGQQMSYYTILKNLLGEDLDSVLFALKDVAFFPSLLEQFESHEKFINSMIRRDRVERLMRQARFVAYDYDLNRLYQFKYLFQPAYAEDGIQVSFDFDADENMPNRVMVLIGKNGAGKTQLLTSLPLNISRRRQDYFMPQAPKFSKVIAVSYSVFDNFELPHVDAEFNYVYCGLRDNEGRIIRMEDLERRFIDAWSNIIRLGRLNRWHQVLTNFLSRDIISNLHFVESPAGFGVRPSRQPDLEGFQYVKTRLSSGQSILLFIISEVTANIRLDSLILYDEPETHLHPNAISELVNSIYELVSEFESYCLFATHSPLVIREIPSKSVLVVDRDEDIPTVRKIGQESFGGNIASLIEEVFGNRSVIKSHEIIIDKLIKKQFDYDTILAMLRSDEIPVTLGTRLYIRSALKLRNEEPESF
jgi:ABC-type cobalamin/Fe3+-siderophores transport system ATPase subunit